MYDFKRKRAEKLMFLLQASLGFLGAEIFPKRLGAPV
jgi:hypothetical protein